MKALARSFIWWPGLDNAIKKTAAHCEPCKTMIAMPKPVVRHPWQLPNGPWERVHVDYEEWNNHHFLALVDAFSMWPEVQVTSTTTANMTITLLSDIFACFGFPQILVSDNGSQFTSTEFQNFLSQHHIIHHKSPSYHPATSGLAENMVESVKSYLKKYKCDGTTNYNIHCTIADFLRTYRNVPHTTTGILPAQLVLAQAPCTHLSMTLPSVYNRLKQQLQPTPEQSNDKVWKFELGDKVLVRDFCPTSTSKWQRGRITAVCGELTYEIDCEGHQLHVHIDHLIPAPMSTTPMSEQLAVTDSPLAEASNQNGSLDTDVLSPPIVDNQLQTDLPTDPVSLPSSMPLSASTHKSSCVRSKPQRLIEEL